jgi:tRNA threonylcarbamoyladenosine biosynthesis protein TsaB
MLHLAIECSGITGSVALCRQGTLMAERQLPHDLSSVRSLAQTIADLLASHPTRSVDLLSVTHGPGSFTGLRTGLATVKMLALAWGIPIVPVDTLHAVAHSTISQYVLEPATHSLSPIVIVPVLNAFRKQVFAAAWRWEDHKLEMLAPAQVVDQALWATAPLASLHGCLPAQPALTAVDPHEALIISGPGLRSYPPNSTWPFDVAPEACWDPPARDVAALGWAGYVAGAAVEAQELMPNYVRESAAEEQARRKR